MISNLVEFVFWSIMVITAIILLIMTITNFVNQIKLDKEFDKLNKKQNEILNKMLEEDK